MAARYTSRQGSGNSVVEFLKAIQEFIQQGGWLAVLLLVLVSGYWGSWVFGWVYKKLEKEKEEEKKQRIFWMNKYITQREYTRRAVSSGEMILASAADESYESS